METTAYKWLVRKIVKQKTRSPGTCVTCQEIANILIYGLVMGWALISMRKVIDVPMSGSPTPEFLVPVLSPCGSAPPLFSKLLFAPDMPITRSVALAAASSLLMPTAAPAANPSCHVEGFATSSELLKAYMKQPTLQTAAAAAILFNAPSSQLSAETVGNYTLAMSRGAAFWKGESDRRDFSWPAVDASILAYAGNNDGATDWQRTGFVSVQVAIDRAIAAVQPGQAAFPTRLGALALQQTRFPLQPFASTYGEGYAPTMAFLLPLFAGVPSLTCSLLLAQLMVVEKAANLPEGLRMMGMTYRDYYGSWFTIYSALGVSGGLLQGLGFYLMGYFPNSDLGLLIILLVLAGLSAIPFAFFQVALVKPKTNDPEAAKNAFSGPAFGLMLVQIGLFATLHFVPNVPLWARAVCGLLPNIATMQGVQLFVLSEVSARGLGWADLLWTDGGRYVPLLGVLGLLLLDALLFFVKAVHDSTAVAKKVAMPKAPAVIPAPPAPPPPPDGLPEVVTIRNLGRTFSARPKPVVALSNLDLSLYEGQISCLLGQNGAGKTTTIGILTGLFPPSEGEATIYGHSTSTAIDQIRKLSGVCPQHDLIFEGLTVWENLALVGSQKGMSDARLASSELSEMLFAVGLEPSKHTTRTGTLSGGQKRKLSLACALIGDPKFLLLDEPTAGMDPASRRTVWQVISKAKVGRAAVLTTHFLDEADALGDRIAVLHKGRLRAVGSNAELKASNGTAYHLTFSLAGGRGSPAGMRRSNGGGTSADAQDDGCAQDPEDGSAAAVVSGKDAAARLLVLTCEHVSEASIEQESVEEVTIRLPLHSSGAFSALFGAVDASAHGLGVSSYGLSVPSLQEVFLKITADANQADADALERSVAVLDDGGGGGLGRADASAAALRPNTTESDVEEGDGAFPEFRSNAHRSYAQVRMGLILYRTAIFSDWQAVFFLGLLPGIMIILTFLLPPLLDKTAAVVVSDKTDPASLPVTVLTPSASAVGLMTDAPLPFTSAAAPAAGGGGLPGALSTLAPGLGFVARDLASNSALNDTLKQPGYGALGAFEIGAAVTTVLYNASLVSSLPLSVALLDRAYFEAAAPGVTLETRASLLPYTGESEVPLPTFYGQLIVPPALSYTFVFIGMTIVIGLVKDRLVDKTTHQLMIMGFTPLNRWLFDGLFWSLQMWFHLSLGIIIVGVFHYYTPYANAIPAFALCILIAVPSLYAFLAAFNFVFWCRKNVEDMVAQVYCNLVQYLAFYPTLLLSAIPYVRDNPVAKNVITYTLLLVPINQISFGLSAIYTISLVSAYKEALLDAPPASVGDYFVFYVQVPGEDGVSPGPLACMVFSIATAPLWFFLLWYIDVRRYYHPSPRIETTRSPPPGEDTDVADERSRVESGGADHALVRMVRLRKEFKLPKVKNKRPPNKVAVADMTLAIDGRGCFALLGPNGAGKTTTLDMLTGVIVPSEGEAFIAGFSVRTELLKIFQLLGYCPQFGGLFPRGVTLRAHLEAFGRLKGVPESMLSAHVSRVVAEFGLQEHTNKWVTKLSGGTKRKLIAAIALSCEPKVCFLDEPTTGVDVGTRQFLWNRIRAKGERGCGLILTTHYMEEADALATRVGIMANGLLRVLGSPQHLKSVHGGGYRIELKGPSSTAAQAKQLIESLFPGSTCIEAHGGFQVFEAGGGGGDGGGGARNAFVHLGPVFAALDGAKDKLGLESYTLSQTTLEQVFLNIAAEQVDDEAGGSDGPPAAAASSSRSSRTSDSAVVAVSNAA